LFWQNLNIWNCAKIWICGPNLPTTDGTWLIKGFKDVEFFLVSILRKQTSKLPLDIF